MNQKENSKEQEMKKIKEARLKEKADLKVQEIEKLLYCNKTCEMNSRNLDKLIFPEIKKQLDSKGYQCKIWDSLE